MAIKKIPAEWRVTGLSEAFWDDAFKTIPAKEYVDALLANGTILDPTLLVYKSMIDDKSIPDSFKTNTIAQWNIAKRFTKYALDRGVPICTGTDSDDKKFVSREIRTLVKEAGFTPMQAIISATLIGAKAIGIEKLTGSIEKNKIANLVLLSANPLLDIDNLGKVMLVIKGGRMYNVR